MEMVAQPQSRHEQRTVGEVKLDSQLNVLPGESLRSHYNRFIHTIPYHAWIEASNIIIQSHSFLKFSSK